MIIRHMLAVLNPRYVFRDSGTGRFVGRIYAMMHPKTTQRERIG